MATVTRGGIGTERNPRLTEHSRKARGLQRSRPPGRPQSLPAAGRPPVTSAKLASRAAIRCAQHVAVHRLARGLELGGGLGERQAQTRRPAGARSRSASSGAARPDAAPGVGLLGLDRLALPSARHGQQHSSCAAGRRHRPARCPAARRRADYTGARSSRVPPTTLNRGPTRAGCSPRPGWRWREHTPGVCAARPSSPSVVHAGEQPMTTPTRGLQGRHPEPHRPRHRAEPALLLRRARLLGQADRARRGAVRLRLARTGRASRCS